ncbi:hypothetical protein EV426DRAFT_703135 [Tirmania nivea]|nr:hypothetical protein EV426DRAFT_703135 [Tirmania nivea]
MSLWLGFNRSIPRIKFLAAPLHFPLSESHPASMCRRTKLKGAFRKSPPWCHEEPFAFLMFIPIARQRVIPGLIPTSARRIGKKALRYTAEGPVNDNLLASEKRVTTRHHKGWSIATPELSLHESQTQNQKRPTFGPRNLAPKVAQELGLEERELKVWGRKRLASREREKRRFEGFE